MAPHDPIFKRLLRLFFADFLRLIVPELVERLDLSAPAFLDKEFPALSPAGKGRIVDLLARVPLRGSEGKALLVHVEIEARASRRIGPRLRDYHRRIQIRHPGQILSVAVFLQGGEAGVREEALEEDLKGPGIPSFRYLAFGVKNCAAADYLERAEPLAWGLAALMNPGSWSRAELKVRCLRKVAGTPLDDESRGELVNCIETYLQLAPGEVEELTFLGQQEDRTMLHVMSWADKMMGEGAQQVVLGVLEQRFGPVPDEVRQRVEKIRSVDRLTRLAQRAMTAKSLKALRLG